LHELQQEQNRDPANDPDDSIDRCHDSRPLASLVLALALALDSPNQVLVQNPAANELRTFALHLEQNHLRLRADYGYVAQVND